MNIRCYFILLCYIFPLVGCKQSTSSTQTISSKNVSFPVRVSTNSRYLVDSNNNPFPILGRTAWFIISQPVNAYQTFIDNCISYGYNAIEINVINHDPRGNHPPFNGNGDKPFLNRMDHAKWEGSLVYNDINKEAPDMTTPNEKYWTYVDNFLSYCASRGILVFLFPAYVGYSGTNQGWMEELTVNGPEKVEVYGAWIANRYKNQKNIVWMLLGDMGTFNTQQKNTEAALIRGLKSVSDQHSVLYTAEANSGQTSRDQEDFGDEMTLNGVYTWDSVGIAKQGLHAYSFNPVMPAFLLEEPYDEEGPDGNSVNPHATQPVRRFQWWGWLTTIGGYISGNGYVWPFVDPYWKNHLDTQGSRDMKHLNYFIKMIPWWELIPSGQNGMRKLITSGEGSDSGSDYIAAAATPTGTYLVAYVPPVHSESFVVNTIGIGDLIEALWFDPTTGTFIKVSGSPFNNTGTLKFAPPVLNSAGQGDWVLVLTPGHK
jgi:hypothetical protein